MKCYKAKAEGTRQLSAGLHNKVIGTGASVNHLFWERFAIQCPFPTNPTSSTSMQVLHYAKLRRSFPSLSVALSAWPWMVTPH